MNIHAVRRRLAAAILAAVAVAVLIQPALAAEIPYYPAQDSSFCEWMDKLAPALRAVKAAQPDDGATHSTHDYYAAYDWRHEQEFIFAGAAAGPSMAEPAAVPGGAALFDAAMYYTLATADNTPTLGELERSGWWPYATIPAGMDRNLVVPQAANGGTIRDKYLLLKRIGSPYWVLSAKSWILQAFYDDFFFRRSGPQRTADELPGSLDAFWINPYTGAGAADTPAAGDYQFEDASQNYYPGSYSPLEPNLTMHYSGGVEALRKEVAKTPRLVRRLNWLSATAASWHELTGRELAPLPPHFRSAAAAQPAQTERAQEWHSAVLDYATPEYLAGLRGILAPLPGATGRQARSDVQLDPGGERAPIELLACPLALELAAKYYAVATLDNQVSLRDLVDSGFWPYDTFPGWLDLSETLYDFPRPVKCEIMYAPEYTDDKGQVYPPSFYGNDADGLGTPNWLLWHKAQILNQAHAELYFSPKNSLLPAEGVDPARHDVLPRFAAFWGDVLHAEATGAVPPLEFGNAPGQLGTVDINLLRPQFEGAHLVYAQAVPLLNLRAKPATGGFVPCGLYVKRATGVGGIEQAQAWRLSPPEGGSTIGEVRWVYPAPTWRQEFVLLDYGFASERFSGKSQAQAQQAYGYGPLNAGQVVVPRGATPTNVMYLGEDIFHTGVRLVYDGIAPLRARYGKDWPVPDGYWWMTNFDNLAKLNQFGAVPCGVDWLAPASEPLTPAALPAGP
jgi:hypothetical protein